MIPKGKTRVIMSSDKLFDAFYAVPNPHFNAFFEASTGESEVHPLADLAPAEAVEMCDPAAATVVQAVGPIEEK